MLLCLVCALDQMLLGCAVGPDQQLSILNQPSVYLQTSSATGGFVLFIETK